MKLVVNKKIAFNFFLLFFLFSVIAGGLTYSFFLHQRSEIYDSLMDKYGDRLQHASMLIITFLSPTVSSADYLSNLYNYHLKTNNSITKEEILADFQLFSQSNLQYKQIRYIGADGKEMIRINLINDSVTTLPKDQLQDKSQRPYFIRSKELNQGEIYLGPVDLNMEHGVIETPHQAVIRAVSPIFDNNNNWSGLVIINQYMNDFFNSLEVLNEQYDAKFSLLNSDGYWLTGPEEFKKFGFMFTDLRDQNLKRFFPEEYEIIYNSADSKGRFISKNGLFVYLHIDIKKKLSEGFNNVMKDKLKCDNDSKWTLFLHLSNEQLRKKTDDIRKDIIITLSIVMAFLIAISYIIASLRYKGKMHMELLHDLNLHLEDMVKKRTYELESANKELEAFSYSVSHDLRAPLRHISGFIELFKRKESDTLTEKGNRYLSTISGSAKEMGALIDDLLQFTNAGRAVIKMEDFDPRMIIDEVIENLKEDTDNRNIKWEIGKLPVVYADYSMMMQVWANLISNAIKYTRTKELAVIEIGAKEEGREYVFYIKDNGVGFDMKYSHKLFGVFQRLHSSDEFEGTGIGLANVKKIIMKHEGRIWGESEPEKGTIFYFTIPKKEKND